MHMKLHLKATMAFAATVMTIKACNRFISDLPLQETLGDAYYLFVGLYYGIVGIIGAIAMVLVGFALYANRNQLPKLSMALRVQSLILIAMMTINLLWHIVFYSVGAANIPDVYTTVGKWWLTVQYILFAAWLWQYVCVKRGSFASEKMGKIGKWGSWIYILAIVAFIACSIVSVTLFSDTDQENNIYTISSLAETILMELIYLLWLVGMVCYNLINRRCSSLNKPCV